MNAERSLSSSSQSTAICRKAKRRAQPKRQEIVSAGWRDPFDILLNWSVAKPTKSKTRQSRKPASGENKPDARKKEQSEAADPAKRKEPPTNLPPAWMQEGVPPIIPTANQHNLFQLKRKLKRDILGSSLEKIMEEPVNHNRNLFATLPTPDLTADLKKWYVLCYFFLFILAFSLSALILKCLP